jgi:hypothetical protein
MKKLVYLSLAVLIASAAFAISPAALTDNGAPTTGSGESTDAIGSIITSFTMSGTSAPYALGIFRDATYVYGIFYSSGTDYLYRFTPSGSSAGSVSISGTSTPRGADKCHLGAGYLCLVDATTDSLYVFSTGGGSPVTSFSCSGSSYPMNCFWDGTYYHTNGSNNSGTFYRYTTTGSSAGTWTCAGWPSAMTSIGGAAYAQMGNNTTGPYFVGCSWTSGQPMCMTTYPAGSLVQTWSMPSNNGNGLCYGDSSNTSTYGASIWCNWYTGSLVAVEVDIDARNGSGITPVSLGKVKSLYR